MKKIVLAIILMSVLIQGCRIPGSEKVKCFEDNAKFGTFDSEKKETFVVDSTSLFEASFEGAIESGKMIVRIYDEDGEDIYYFEGKEFNDNVSAELKAGNYYYYIKAEKCTNGRFHNKGSLTQKK